MDTIKLTVGLPMFNSKHIAWLAFESLCNQKNINFDWEIVIEEEQNELMFGEKNVNEYAERLYKTGCKQIVYKALSNWIPLARKWRNLGWAAAPTSQYFLIQATDNYSQPYRLKETYDMFSKADMDWVTSTKGLFYIIKTEEIIVIDEPHNKVLSGYSGLSMATKTEYMRRLPISDKERNIDGWLVRTVSDLKEGGSNFGIIETNTWDMTLYTHGLNNISLQRYEPLRGKYPQRMQLNDLKDKIPQYIIDKLLECKSIAKL